MSEIAILTTILIVTNAVLAVGIGWSTRAAMLGRLKLNPIAGIRTARTMRTQEGWQAGHAAAWPLAQKVIALCAGCSLIAMILLLTDQGVAAAVLAAIPTAGVLLATWPMVKTAGEAADQANGVA